MGSGYSSCLAVTCSDDLDAPDGGAATRLLDLDQMETPTAVETPQESSDELHIHADAETLCDPLHSPASPRSKSPPAAASKQDLLAGHIISGDLARVSGFLREENVSLDDPLDLLNGDSPLFFAVRNRSRDLVILLVNLGADVHALDKDGKSIEDVAQSTNDIDIIEFVGQSLCSGYDTSTIASASISMRSCGSTSMQRSVGPTQQDLIFLDRGSSFVSECPSSITLGSRAWSQSSLGISSLHARILDSAAQANEVIDTGSSGPKRTISKRMRKVAKRAISYLAPQLYSGRAKKDAKPSATQQLG